MLRDVLLTCIPAFGSLLVGMALSRKLAALAHESSALDRKFHAVLDRNGPRLRRPDYRPRWRFPFRTLRSASLWVILAVLASRSRAWCAPDLQPAVIDCAHDDSRLARMDCSLAATLMVDSIERLRR